MDEDQPFEREDLTTDAFLGGDVEIMQPKSGYRAATDAVFLAAACPAVSGQSILELGCGAGTVLLCLDARVTNLSLTGIETQLAYADLARQNADHNDAQVSIRTGDLRNASILTNAASFDHVLMNPPYYGPGAAADDAGRAAALQEDTPLATWIDAGIRRLKPKGHITMIHLTERLADILELLNPKAGAIEIKPLSAREGRSAKRVIIRARKDSRAPTTLYSPLILHDGPAHERDGDSFSEPIRHLLRRPTTLEF